VTTRNSPNGPAKNSKNWLSSTSVLKIDALKIRRLSNNEVFNPNSKLVETSLSYSSLICNLASTASPAPPKPALKNELSRSRLPNELNPPLRHKGLHYPAVSSLALLSVGAGQSPESGWVCRQGCWLKQG